MDNKEFTLVEHLSELRKRIIIIAVVILAASFASYNYVEIFVQDILKQASQMEFVYLSPPELFLAYIKISLIVGITISSPIVLYEIWAFIKPGLMSREKTYILASLLGGILFFAMGVIFAYKVVLPFTIRFFVNIRVDGIKPTISFGNYIGFIGSILLAFGLVFEMPILSILLTKLKIINANMLKKNTKIVILGIFIIAAVLTPPDVVSQILLAGPMVLLFEISILLSKIVGREKK